MQKAKELLGKYPALSGIVMVVILMLLFKLLPLRGSSGSALAQLPVEIVIGIITLALMALIGGVSVIRPSGQGVGFSLRKAIYLLIIAAVSGLISVSAQISAGTPLVDNWFGPVIALLVLDLFVGIFEEGMCRGLLLNGLLGSMGKTRTGMIWAVVISSLVFGLIHVVAQIADPASMTLLGWAQILGKTLQAGLVGFLLAAIYLKTHNIWCGVIVHGLNDFLIMVAGVAFGASSIGVYVQTDPTLALIEAIVYAVFTLISIPFAVTGMKILKRIQVPQNGFYKDTWDTHEPAVMAPDRKEQEKRITGK